MENKRKICLWSVAAFILSPLSISALAVESFAAESVGFVMAVLFISVLISSILPPLAEGIRLKNSEKGKAFEIVGLIISAFLNFCVLTLAFMFYGGIPGLWESGYIWLFGWVPPVASIVAYVVVSKKMK